jgi:GST-like protein
MPLMITFYFNLGPNPMKVALCLEEMGLPYDTVLVDGRRGEQFAPDFLAVNPNGKLPAIVDGGTRVFDSNAILLYLAEKTGRFLPEAGAQARADLLSWLMFVASGVGPYSGQAVHFKHNVPTGNEYGTSRYVFEVRRHYRILDERLAAHRYILGDAYTIVDMALWGWARVLPRIFGDEPLAAFPNVKRLMAEIDARPAAARAIALRDRSEPYFKADMDEAARQFMFRHLKEA